ncbi:ABC transporter permease [Rhizobium giardinii]|uniref:Glycine betaine/proline transport system permease protein n=1 Tax=Rhizobium giardinii TaxID=56731 RepID=A0A7W8XAY7_9HYPH|nr:proline/glycine betaine ABC transporter permease [Rhizobium giardinii]MBB5538729.1 glycine betaine/proline transport system permease protein [Rhizobium giardinii]
MREVLKQDESFDAAIARFVGENVTYYQTRFKQIFSGQKRPRPNFAALLLGPIWAAARGMFGLFVVLALIEVSLGLAITGVASGGLGKAELVQSQQLQARSDSRRDQALKAQAAGDANAPDLLRSADSLAKAAQQAKTSADQQQRLASLVISLCGAALVIFRVLFSLSADSFYAKRFEKWRSNRQISSGSNIIRAVLALLVVTAVFFLSLGKVNPELPPDWLAAISKQAEQFSATKDFAVLVTKSLDELFSAITRAGGPFFDAITLSITSIVNAVEYALNLMPWPAVVVVIVGIALLLSGHVVATFTALGLIYLVAFGFWTQSLATIALLGTATFLALCIGLPLGIACGKNQSIYRAIRPVLDLMQTMPAFVYLIPIIAFFGTGKTPGILATIVFGMPPVARLTALGLQQVPENVKEASAAFGATPWQLLFKVEVPLAMPSIMAGVNQTILMCLSMVVIASLIGAGGLGEDVLQALQYASVGQGILAGTAILFCAIILDRIVQGRRTS